jgi:hypothetical protein
MDRPGGSAAGLAAARATRWGKTMRSTRTNRLGAWIAVLLLAPARPALPRGGAPLPTEWNQPHGNAASTAFVDVAPLKVPPTERWRIATEKLLAGPIVSLNHVLVAVREGKLRKLVALDPTTGAVVAHHVLEGSGDVVGIAASGRLVAVVEPAVTRTFRLTGEEFKFERTMSGTFAGEPTLVDQTLLVAGKDGRGLYLLDLSAGRADLVEPNHFGRASEFDVGGKPAIFHLDSNDDFASYQVERETTARSGSRVTLESPARIGGGLLVKGQGPLSRSVLVSADADDAGSWYAWVGSPSASTNSASRAAEITFQTPPAAREKRLFGVNAKGTLIELRSDRRAYLPLIATSLLPKGARIGPPSIARDVLYVGNFAIEIGSKRLLWCVETLETSGPTVPSGDEMVVVTTPAGELVGYGNGPPPAPAEGAPALAPAAKGTKPGRGEKAAAPPPAFAMPGSKPGLIRSDGLFVAGSVSALDAGRWRVEPEGGEAKEYDADAVALVDAGDGGKLLGDELPLYRACLAAVKAEHVEVLVGQVPPWRELKFYEECRRLIDEAKRCGLSAERVDELNESIVGRKSTTAGNADVQKRHLLEVETAAREKTAKSVEAAAAWCAARGAKVAATALLQRRLDFLPGRPVDPATIEPWLPEYLPFGADKAEQAKAWGTWAEELLPSGARFVRADEALAKRLAKTPFATKSALLRTNHVLIVTRELDPKVIGPCLVRGEAAFRALKRLLGPCRSGEKPDELLEVRLYPTRADYLADASGGFEPPKWSVGVYSPKERVSRFYARMESDAEDPLGRSLHLVMAHELTHHYVDRCWDPSGDPHKVAGFWMVEGFAEFVAEQAVEVGRLGDAFDDATVLSLDLSAAVARVDKLLPLELLLALDKKKFDTELEGKSAYLVQARHTLRRTVLDRRGVFYVESAALTFFVMNRFGEKGRAAYIDWFAKLERGEAVAEPWKELGFSDRDDFEMAFRHFLGEL